MNTLWLAAFAMTALAVVAVVTPLILRQRRQAPERRAFDIAVYRDQLAEIERDLDRGLVTPDEAEAARVEIQRRMLAAADAAERHDAPDATANTIAVAAVSVAIPLVAFGLYLTLGAPGKPDQPFASRTDTTQTAGEADTGGDGRMDPKAVREMAKRLEDRLRARPNDADGWALLARTYLSINDFEKGLDAYEKAMEVRGNDPDIVAGYGEALVMQAQGRVDGRARVLFEAARRADPYDPRARYYLGLGLAQQGDRMGALQAWVDLKKVSPPGAPWLETVEDQIARVAEDAGVAPWSVKPSAEAETLARARPAPAAPSVPPAGAAPGPTREDVEAASEMSAADRRAMIRSMVERLAGRLKQNSSDEQGWRRLARAYEVLGEADKARDALARADALAGGASSVPAAPVAPPPAATPGPSREDMEAASEMSAADRQAMIRSMVERLAQRLEDDPDDEQGWRMLARSYRVLGETEKANKALARADALANKIR